MVHDSPLGVCQKEPKDYQMMRNKIIWSDETKIDLFGQASRLEETWHHPYGEARWWQHHAVGMFFSGIDWETGQDWGKDEQRERALMKACSRVLRTLDWGEGWPSNRTTTLSTQPRQHRSLWMSLSGPARARNWTRLDISGEIWKRGEAPQIQWNQACSVIPKKTQGCNRCQRFFNKVLSKVSEFSCKCYISVKFFNTFAKTMFLFCHYGVLCVDWWGEKNNLIYFRIRL